MRWIMILSVMVIVVGCAESRYLQGGKPLKERERDMFQCEDKVLAEHKGGKGLSVKEKQDLLDDCMKAKGYQVRQ
jgi:hypothetical protein